MLSRVANSIYWMNRYMERVENYARFVSVNFNLALDLPRGIDEQWEPLLVATADINTYYAKYSKPTREEVIYFMTFDKSNPNSILCSLSNARENARTIREAISREMWESINTFYLWLKEVSPDQLKDLEHMQDFFTRVRQSCQLFQGIVDSTFIRNEAWHFGQLGRHIERADKSSRFLDVNYFSLHHDNSQSNSTLDLMLWNAVLKSVSAYNVYWQTFRKINPQNIVSFLILDKTFPRSIAYCVKEAEVCLYAIGGGLPGLGYTNLAEKLISKLRAEMEFTEIEDIFKKGLHHYLDEFQSINNQLDSAIFDLYFDLKPTTLAPFSQERQFQNQ